MAHQGYWPGGVPRHGFRLVPADNGRNRIEVDEVEEILVKKVFHLAEYGDGDGPMGVKAIVNWTQRNGALTRYGAPFSTHAIHRMLTFEGYNGGGYPHGVDPSPDAFNSAPEQIIFNFTSIFPMFWPLKSPRKASGAFSMPRKTV